jgi:ankyrin repeat protein
MFGLWPIHLAVQRRPVSVVKFLIEDLGVDAEIEDPKDYTPFMLAVDWGNEEVVRYFIRERRAQLEANKEQVAKAAHLAAANWKRLGILRLILEEARDLLDESEMEALEESAITASNVEAAIYLLSKSPVVKTTVVGADTELTKTAPRSLKTSNSDKTLRDSLSNTIHGSDSIETLHNSVSDSTVPGVHIPATS